MHYFTSKGLFVRSVDNDKYVIEDIFGTCSIPFNSSKEKLDENLKQMANIKKLVTLRVTSEFPDLSDFNWSDLEYYYVSHIHYAFLNSILEHSCKEHFHSVMAYFPIAYTECGSGAGSKQNLELIHNEFKESCSTDGCLVSEQDLNVFLITKQVERICSDIMSLLNRAIFAYSNLLNTQRNCIDKSRSALVQLKTSEIVHSGKYTYQSATEITSLVISLCSSLDLSAKLIQYINSIVPEKLAFKAARDQQHHEVKKNKSKFFSTQFIDNIVRLQATVGNLPELIQFRNDLIHSTSAIELEKIYVGLGGAEINDLPLYYTAQYSRDCLDSGQPYRFLGRDYFTDGQLDIEVKALSWINTVIHYQLEVGKEIHAHLVAVRKPNLCTK